MHNPTYYKMGDHTETFQVDFDPNVVSYQQLLKLFWEGHNPHRAAWSRQYRSVILYHNDAQRQEAERIKDALAAMSGKAVQTPIEPLRQFYLAEDYHQKYSLQKTALVHEIKRHYPRKLDWVESTAAARLNSCLSGYGKPETFADDIQKLGLSSEGESELRKRVLQRHSPLACPLN